MCYSWQKGKFESFQLKIWSSHLLDNLSNCLMNLKNSGDSTGFEPMTSAMPVPNPESRIRIPLSHLNFSGSWDNCLNCPASARIIFSVDFKHRTSYNTSFESFLQLPKFINLTAYKNIDKTSRVEKHSSLIFFMKRILIKRSLFLMYANISPHNFNLCSDSQETGFVEWFWSLSIHSRSFVSGLYTTIKHSRSFIKHYFQFQNRSYTPFNSRHHINT